MTTDQHSITKSGGTVVFTMPFPSGSLDDLLPHWSDLQGRKVTADLVPTGSNAMTLTVSSLDVTDMEPWYQTVVWVIQHFWQELVAHGFATGPMPNIVHHDSLDMLPTTA